MKDSEIVSRLRGFIDINGDEAPNSDQWNQIVKMVFDTEEEYPKKSETGISPELDELIKKSRERGPYGPLPSNPWKLPPSVGSPIWPFPGPPDDPYKIIYASNPEGSTALCEGFILSNEIGDIDMDGLELSIEMESKPNILETNSVEFSFEPGDPPSDVRNTRPDG